MNYINYLLYRQIRSDYEEDIFPKSQCKITELGNGDTFFSVQQIAKMITKNAYQCNKIANRLKANTLEKTISNIQDFLFSHFQYKADEQTQRLRSPACSWKERFNGIDCKSYTILGGAILKCLNINFAIRQVKQPNLNPDYFSHVYIVVPKNQKNNDLTNYFVIDGTLRTMNEVLFIEKDDYFMRHIGLNAPAFGGNFIFKEPQRGLSSSISPLLPYSANSGVSSNANTGVTTYAWQNKANNILNQINAGANVLVPALSLVDNFVQLFGGKSFLSNYNSQGGNAQTIEELKAQIQQNANNQQYMYQMMQTMMLAGQKSEESKKDYTPYIIGGVALVGVLAVVFLMNDKK